MPTIRPASPADIPTIEAILLDAVHWIDSIGLHQWNAENVRWGKLSQFYAIGDFHIAYHDGIPAACAAIIDYDPAFWPNIPRGESLFLHKVAVKREYAGMGFSTQVIDYAKEKAREMGIKTLRLDCHYDRAKVRSLYEQHGFVCVDEQMLFGSYHTAFYVLEL